MQMKFICLTILFVIFASASVSFAKDWKAEVQELIQSKDVILFGKTYCPYCRRAKEALREAGIEFFAVELDEVSHGPELQRALMEISGQRTVPNVFCKGTHIGGSDKVISAIATGLFAELLSK